MAKQVSKQKGQPPEGWFKAGSNPDDYEMGVDHKNFHSGQASGFIKANTHSPRGFGTLMQMFQANMYRGKRVRMSGYVKAKQIIEWAGLWMRVDGPDGKSMSFDNMQNRSIKGTSDWTKYKIVLDVPKKSVHIAFGILLRGKGQAWIDDLKFEVVGRDIPTTDLSKDKKLYSKRPLNLDFEG